MDGGVGKCSLGEMFPAAIPPASKGEQQCPSMGKRKKSPSSPGRGLQLVSYFLHSSFRTPFLSLFCSPNPELEEALSSPAVRADGAENLMLLSGDLSGCQGRKKVSVGLQCCSVDPLQ